MDVPERGIPLMYLDGQRSAEYARTPGHDAPTPGHDARLRPFRMPLAIGFVLLGLLNNLPYVVILAAAQELLPPHTPTGLVTFVNIAPALLSKAIFPYFLKGEIQYTFRVWACVLLAIVGMLTIAMFSSLTLRLIGIGIASFGSGLGEVSYLQYSTRYPFATTMSAVGLFSSGTGAAGLLGALAWWLVRPLGIRTGIGLLSLLPLGMALAFFVILPAPHAWPKHSARRAEQDEAAQRLMDPDGVPAEDQDAETEAYRGARDGLSFAHKMRLLRPMLFPYVLPLVCVYFAEYTINQGVAPTLLYPVPSSAKHPLLAAVIHSLRDYYPLYQLIYQTFVFCSRSYTSVLQLPPIPKSWLWSPAIVQFTLLGLMVSESVFAWFRESIARSLVIVLVAVEGLAGGAA
ncbi:battenin CLN3 protein [Malassezia vespertilionis]|nr:battenin CLN3 protein [Malassezia vespertilionis]WFD06215.1 battenin CLN3 protein [Malassezia vespertilionis]